LMETGIVIQTIHKKLR